MLRTAAKFKGNRELKGGGMDNVIVPATQKVPELQLYEPWFYYLTVPIICPCISTDVYTEEHMDRNVCVEASPGQGT